MIKPECAKRFKKSARNWAQKAGVVSTFILLSLVIAGNVQAANSTDAKTATATAVGSTSIKVTMPYKGDDNSSNTYTVGYKVCNAPSYANWVTNAAHTASPYVTTITGLTANTCYEIQATYNDADGVSGKNPQYTRISSTWDDTMLHNINRFGALNSVNSTKWSARNGWGMPGTKYGQFTCDTCHLKATQNIKRVKETITSPNAPTDTFPLGSGAANFKSKTSPDGFGNDSAGHATSTKICEVCHSANKYHNYNTANNTGGLTHNNNTDCIGCHPHNRGFFYSAACDGCHDYDTTGGGTTWGNSAKAIEGFGAHAKHIEHIKARYLVSLNPNGDQFGAGAAAMVCGTCHTNLDGSHSTGGGGTRSINFGDANYKEGGSTGFSFLFDPAAPGTNPPTYNGFVGNSSLSDPKTCSNISCHFQTTPVWSSY